MEVASLLNQQHGCALKENFEKKKKQIVFVLPTKGVVSYLLSKMSVTHLTRLVNVYLIGIGSFQVCVQVCASVTFERTSNNWWIDTMDAAGSNFIDFYRMPSTSSSISRSLVHPHCDILGHLFWPNSTAAYPIGSIDLIPNDLRSVCTMEKPPYSVSYYFWLNG